MEGEGWVCCTPGHRGGSPVKLKGSYHESGGSNGSDLLLPRGGIAGKIDIINVTSRSLIIGVGPIIGFWKKNQITFRNFGNLHQRMCGK